MKQKNILILIIGLVLVISFVYAASILNRSYDFVNVEESAVSGNVNVKISETTRSELDILKVDIKIWDAHQEEGEVFEAWLVDEDTEYELSLGALETNKVGTGKLKFNAKVVNAQIYDQVVITRESVNDENPTSSDVALIAEIETSDEIVALHAELNGDNEFPSTISEATGTGMFELNTVENTLSFNITYSEIESGETGAHIHGFAPNGENAGVLFELPSENPKIGVWNYDEEQEDDILAGLTYVNIHSSEYPSGEIRGQIVPLD